MKILVTGGLGYIGSHVVVELCAAGYEPVIVDNLSNARGSVLERLERLTQRKLTHFDVDIRNRAAMETVLQQAPCDGNNASHFIFAAWGHVKAHHCPLGKTKQNDLLGQDIFVHHQRIKEGVKVFNGGIHATFGFFFGRSVNVGDREPLIAIWSTVTNFGCIW